MSSPCFLTPVTVIARHRLPHAADVFRRHAMNTVRCSPAGRRSSVQATALFNSSSLASQSKSQETEELADCPLQLVDIYDTTLRDGAQGEGISFTARDKIHLAERLDAFGVSYIEGGWPGSNPKDATFFAECPRLKNAKLVAFGSTRYKHLNCENDKNVQALKAANTPAVTLVGKAWDMQVKVVLETTLEENLAMIYDTVAYFKALSKEVMLDAGENLKLNYTFQI